MKDAGKLHDQFADLLKRGSERHVEAMETGLELVFRFLESNGQAAKTNTVVVECRGRKEDAALELAFRRVCDGANRLGRSLPLNLVMVSKAANSAGLQYADLMARPVGLHHMRPEQPNRAFDIVATKLRRSPAGKTEGWGLENASVIHHGTFIAPAVNVCTSPNAVPPAVCATAQ